QLSRLQTAKIVQIVRARHFHVIGRVVVDLVAQQRQRVPGFYFDKVGEVGRLEACLAEDFIAALVGNEGQRHLRAQRFAARLEQGVVDSQRFHARLEQ